MYKFSKLFTPVIFLFLSLLNVFSQENVILNSNDISIGFKISVGWSMHEDPFVDLHNINEYATYLKYNLRQSSAKVVDFDLDVLLKITQKHKLLIGVGLNKYGFNQQQTNIYETVSSDTKIKFLNIKAGHYFDLFNNRAVNLSIANILQLDTDLVSGNLNINKYSISYQVVIELGYNYSNTINLFVPFYYKHALRKYNRVKHNRDYYPYSYGLGIGVRYKMDNK